MCKFDDFPLIELIRQRRASEFQRRRDRMTLFYARWAPHLGSINTSELF
jgi:hypothetical protein